MVRLIAFDSVSVSAEKCPLRCACSGIRWPKTPGHQSLGLHFGGHESLPAPCLRFIAYEVRLRRRGEGEECFHMFLPVTRFDWSNEIGRSDLVMGCSTFDRGGSW